MTDVALKEYLEKQLDALRAEMHKSETLLNIRLEGMNEFRAALKDQSAQMATREYTDLNIEKLDTRLRSLEGTRAYNLGIAAGVAVLISAIVTIIGVLVA